MTGNLVCSSPQCQTAAGCVCQSASPAGALTAEKAGYVLVPREPTEAMLQGACTTHKVGAPMNEHYPIECPHIVGRRKIWARMIAAAEQTQAPDAGIRSALPPSSAREKRMENALRVAKQLCDNINEFSHVTDAVFLDEAITAIDDALALSSDGRGREKGNTSNASEGVDPSPPATNRSES